MNMKYDSSVMAPPFLSTAFIFFDKNSSYNTSAVIFSEVDFWSKFGCLHAVSINIKHNDVNKIVIFFIEEPPIYYTMIIACFLTLHKIYFFDTFRQISVRIAIIFQKKIFYL